MCSAPLRSVSPRISSSPTRYIHPADPVYHVQPPRPVCGGARIDVGRHDVRLGAILLHFVRRASVVHRVDQSRTAPSRDRRRQAARTPARSRSRRACTGRRSRARRARIPGCSPDSVCVLSNGGVSKSTSFSARRTRCSSVDSIAVARVRDRPSPAITAHDCAIASIRHSAFALDPSGVPSSKYARRYQAPSHAVLGSRGERGRVCR